MYELSRRVRQMNFSQTFVMSNRVRELKAEGKDVISLTLGEPDFDVPELVKQSAHRAIDENYSHYSPVPGFLEVRQAVCDKLKRDNGLHFEPKNICVSTGAKQAIFNVLAALINPGDEVLIPAPYWVSYSEMIHLLEGVPVSVHTSVETEFKVTPDQIQNHITPKTKALLFSTPCNPSGSFYTEDELMAIAEVLEKYPSVIVISDEIYEYLVYEGEAFSIAQIPSMKDRCTVINGLSKGYAMTGWRLGYSACPDWLAKGVEMIQGQVTSGANTLAQRAAITALKMAPEELLEMKTAFRRRRDLMYGLLSEIPGMKINLPKSAFYFFPDVSDFFGKTTASGTEINDGDSFAMALLNEGLVGSVGGNSFGNENCIRFSYATSDEAITESMNRLKTFISELR